MFEKFNEFFSIKNIIEKEIKLGDLRTVDVNGFQEFFSKYEGKSLGEGIYRIHKYKNIVKWNNIISNCFPKYNNKIYCFGYDWLGRQFALDFNNIFKNEPQILMFEPGTGCVLNIPCDFIKFHENEITTYSESCLSSDFFKIWIKNNNYNLKLNECAAYRIPLFLGGKDELENIVISDIELYWEICTQLINETKNLPLGTVINNIEIN